MIPRWICAISGLAALVAIAVAGPAYGEDCRDSFDSTFELIQAAIFERNGCTSVTCHTPADRAGGLDLTAAAAYADLVDAPVQSVAVRAGVRRVVPAKKENSILWLNLAAATLPGMWRAPLQPMPLGFPPLSIDELEVVRLWIEGGAPERGVVAGTDGLLDACLPPARPLETRPLDPPPPGTGVQFRAPRQILPAQRERETCFISYYDITDQVPEQFRGPGGDTFRYARIDARQDPLSHHAVVVNYTGVAPLNSPAWGAFTCGGGALHGEPCEPSDLSSCGDEGVCGSEPRVSVGCFGYGPGDAGIGFGNESLFNTMAAGLGSVEGVYAEAPLKGILVWNSHAFNFTDEPGKLDIWVNLEFAPPQAQVHELKRFTIIDAMFSLAVPPFGAQELCGHHVVSPRTRIIELSSHNHQRGVRFQTFEGAFRCRGGGNDGAACSPVADGELGAPDICRGAPCQAHMPPAAGDCNGDLVVRVDEMVTAVNVALGVVDVARCRRADADRNGIVTVAELITGVRALLHPVLRDPIDSTLYTSIYYADPAVVPFDPPLVLGGPDSVAEERTLTYCGLFDNGGGDPAIVKRRSTSPPAVGSFPGGPCDRPVACVEGRVGARCGSDAECDSAVGSGDGFCDACNVIFGSTTDDEMFILLGAAYEE